MKHWQWLRRCQSRALNTRKWHILESGNWLANCTRNYYVSPHRRALQKYFSHYFKGESATKTTEELSLSPTLSGFCGHKNYCQWSGINEEKELSLKGILVPWPIPCFNDELRRWWFREMSIKMRHKLSLCIRSRWIMLGNSLLLHLISGDMAKAEKLKHDIYVATRVRGSLFNHEQFHRRFTDAKLVAASTLAIVLQFITSPVIQQIARHQTWNGLQKKKKCFRSIFGEVWKLATYKSLSRVIEVLLIRF